MVFDYDAYDDFLIDNGCLGIWPEPRTLASARISHTYANIRTVTELAATLENLTNFIHDYAKSRIPKFDCFYGVPEGATKTAVIANYRFCERVPMGRGGVKEHGDPINAYFVTAPRKGEKVAVLEDVWTTGQSTIQKGVEPVQKAGAEVVAVIANVDRLERMGDATNVSDKSIADELNSRGIQACPMTDIERLLNKFLKNNSQPEAMLKEIEDYSVRYGSRQLHLVRN